jgi:hypothetical protein
MNAPAKQELQLAKSNVVVSQDSQSIMRLVEKAMDTPNFDVDKLNALLAVKERWEAGEAKKAYTEAMTEFKSSAPIVTKDRDNLQYNSKYTSIGNLVNTINPHLSQYGLSARWDIDQSNGIRVTCVMTHRLGHSESTSMSGPPDNSGKKNPLQEIKSTITYLKAATFEAITGLASTDANLDDDGNGSSDKDMPQDEFEGFAKRIRDATTKEAAKSIWQESVKASRGYNDIDAANKRKQVLLDQSKFIDSTKVTA